LPLSWLLSQRGEIFDLAPLNDRRLCAYSGRWKVLSTSLDGTNRFERAMAVLLNKNMALDRQIRLLKQIARRS
jgi:hypothetical protein